MMIALNPKKMTTVVIVSTYLYSYHMIRSVIVISAIDLTKYTHQVFAFMDQTTVYSFFNFLI